MNKWKQRLSIVIAVIFTSLTLLGNIPAQAAGMNKISSKKTVTTSQKVSKNKKYTNKKATSYKTKKITKGKKTYYTKKNKNSVLKNKKSVKKQVKTKQVSKAKVTPKKNTPKQKVSDDGDAAKKPREIVLITPGVVRGGKSIKSIQNVTGNLRMTAQKVTYNNANISGDLYVSADNCNVNNLNVKGTIYVDPGEKGNANLNNITCNDIKILSGAKESIHLNNVKVANNLLVESKNLKESVRVEIKGQTAIKNTQVSSSSILDVVDGSFGNINVLGTTSEKNVIEFKGIFDKTISVQSAITIKATSGAVLPEIQIVPDKKDSKIVLEGNFKNVIVNKESKLDIAPKVNIDRLVVNIKSDIRADKTAKITRAEDKFKCINTTDVPSTITSSGMTSGSAGSSTNTNNASKEVTVNIRVEGYDHTVISRKQIKVGIFDLQKYLKKGTGPSATPSEGRGVDKFTQPTVAHAIVEALKERGVTYDFQDYGWSCYMAMIDGDREKDEKRGSMSGWVYMVDGERPNIGCQAYKLKGGENIVWYYGAYGFENVYTTLNTDKDKVDIGESVTVILDGEDKPVADATIIVNGREFKINGKAVKTNSDGKAVLKFDSSGKYSITATRKRTSGKEAGSIDIIKPEESIVEVRQGSNPGNPGNPGNPDIPVKSVSIDKQELEIAVGEIKKIIATVVPENSKNKKLTWKSSNKNVATVDISGNVTAISEGTSDITVTTEDGNKTASCTITVKKKDNGTGSEVKKLKEVKDEKSGTSLLIQENKDNTLTMLLEGKTVKANTIVTITLFNTDNDLKYIGQAVIKDGKLEFNTSLEAGKYIGFYNVENSNKVEIGEIIVK